MSWGPVKILNEFNVAIAMKDGDVYKAPLNSNGEFSFSDFEKIENSYLEIPRMIREINEIFGISLDYGGLWKPTKPFQQKI